MGPATCPANTYTAQGYTQPFLIGVSTSVPAGGNRGAHLVFNPVLTDPARQLWSFRDGRCHSINCDGLAMGVVGRTGSASVFAPPVTVPTMTGWAMILFGLLLAGGAAMRLGRRRQAQA